MTWEQLIYFIRKHNLDPDGEVVGHIIDLEIDNEYYQAILDGNWPSSVEILEKALIRAKEKQNEGA